MINPPCANLETKKVYVPALQDTAFKVKGDAGYEGHFWCCQTGAEFGPDDDLVNLNACSNCNRSCFEAE
jgi:hypothetical protein